MKYLSENLMWHISSQVGELKKIVQQNRETLSEIRESFDKPDVMKDLIRYQLDWVMIIHHESRL